MAMTTSGSKGNDKNLGQIMSCLGQQVVAVKQPDRPIFKQQRIPYNSGKIKGGFDGRTLPHFHRHDDGAKARGFCRNSFLVGLDPFEFFFHNASGREGLIDTAIKSVTGDTPIVILEDGECKRVLIGDWIDEHMAKRPKDIERLPAMDQELLQLKTQTYVPTCDDDGHMSWGEMTAITRHDPTTRMFKVTTQGGRSVTVVESKSLIVWNGQQFIEKPTPELKIGDFLPVTQSLPEPPSIIENINMTTYFPKNKFLYGRDFEIAKSMYVEMMTGRRQAVRGWWELHNGTDFELPYSRIQLFSRAITRSYTEFRSNCLYPFDGNRTCGHIPARFPLNHENGRFIGIYLADGDTDRHAGSVRISNNNDEVIDFVKSWFDNHGIKYEETVKAHRILNGTSRAIRGFSRMLADFLDAVAGRHSHHKYVPSASFCGTRQHVIGLVEGYYSCDGGLSHGYIQSNSASKQLTEGIAMLLSRLNIFGQISLYKSPTGSTNVTDKVADCHRLTIRSQAAHNFSSNVNLINTLKDKQLKALQPLGPRKKKSLQSHNDVVLDPVVSIQSLDAISFPKVYDVTVPKTFNFGLADGLQIHDTADTGYLQRRLIKLMEDGKVYYDGTVRNSSRLILQFSYGCDGFEAIRLESDTMCKTLFSMKDFDLLQTFKLSAHEDWTKIVDAKIRAEIKKDTDLEKLLDDEYELIYGYREIVRNEIFQNPVGKSSLNAKTCDAIETQMPVKMSRLISNTRSKFKARKKLSDLNPRHIVESVDRLLAKLTGMPEDASDYMKRSIEDNRLLHRIIVRLHLSSKRVLTDYRLTKDMFDYVIIAVEEHFRRAIAHPGDMVGIIAAQSLGQPTTQMTLNSVHYETELLIEDEGKLRRVKIGEYVDDHLDDLIKSEKQQPKAIERHPNDTLLGHLKESSKVRILACDQDGKIAWQRIEAVTRHPVVNEDGTDDVIKVTTHSGREVIATRGKSFLHRKDNKIVPIEGKDLEVGMYLPVSKVLPIEHSIDHLDVSDYLSKSEFLFMTEVEKALESKKINGKQWWTGFGGLPRIRGHWRTERPTHGVQDFELPYKRGDTFCEAFLGRPGAAARRAKNCKPGCVYPRVVKEHAADVPEKIRLDEEFGFFVGAYLAEGGCTDYHLMISNNDDAFNDRIDSFCRQINLHYHIQDEVKNGGRSKTLRTHSLVLTRLFTILFGNGAANKRIPAQFLAAPDSFLKGLIDGYFSGDGTVPLHGNFVAASSISRGLMEDIRQVLVRFGITSKISHNPRSLIRCQIKFPDAQPGYEMYIGAAQSVKFRKTFRFTIAKKQIRLDAQATKMLFDQCDVIPNCQLADDDKTIRRCDLQRNIDDSSSLADTKILENILSEDVIYDKIISLDRIKHDRPWIYDLTVSGPRTFNIYSGLTENDTFHQAGQATQFNVVDGVPRLEELISASAKPKAPAITIYLNREFGQDEDRAEVVRNKLRQTRLSDLAKSSEIVYDPNDQNTLLAQDMEFLQSYYAFMRENNCNFDSAWVLRLELDKEKMLERNIRMWEIEQALIDKFTNEIQCVFADDNAKQLVVRIRASNDVGMDRPDEDQDIIFLLKQLEKSLMDSLVLRGIEGIKNAFIPARESRPYMETVAEDGSIIDDSDQKEIVIIAEQSVVGENSLLEIFKLTEVDETRTMSNYVGDVLALLGIEAARNMLFREIHNVFSTSEINHRHIEMLVDTMTCKGDLTKINRMGINKLNVGPLARCSFEETETQFMNAAAFAEEDTFRGVSSNTMLGQYYPGGTGECEVLLDEDMLADHFKNQAPETIEEKPEEEELAQEEEESEDDQEISDSQLGFDFSLDDTVTAQFA